jgi:hypothetical protein
VGEKGLESKIEQELNRGPFVNTKGKLRVKKITSRLQKSDGRKKSRVDVETDKVVTRN